MRTVAVPKPLFALMYLCSWVVAAVGCVCLLAWMVTGVPHPNWVRVLDDAGHVVIHRTAPSPIPAATDHDDLIPPTDLPTR